MIDESAQRSWHFKQLRWSLQNLAAATSGQPPLFPEAAHTADELALDFDHWASVVLTSYEEELSGAQVESLGAIDAQLKRMSRDGREFDADLWTDRALTTSPQWVHVRTLAASALEAFGWTAAAASRSS
jgi:hypothetical protein